MNGYKHKGPQPIKGKKQNKKYDDIGVAFSNLWWTIIITTGYLDRPVNKAVKPWKVKLLNSILVGQKKKLSALKRKQVGRLLSNPNP